MGNSKKMTFKEIMLDLLSIPVFILVIVGICLWGNFCLEVTQNFIWQIVLFLFPILLVSRVLTLIVQSHK
jgi:hypothetical protein